MDLLYLLAGLGLLAFLRKPAPPPGGDEPTSGEQERGGRYMIGGGGPGTGAGGVQLNYNAGDNWNKPGDKMIPRVRAKHPEDRTLLLMWLHGIYRRRPPVLVGKNYLGILFGNLTADGAGYYCYHTGSGTWRAAAIADILAQPQRSARGNPEAASWFFCTFKGATPDRWPSPKTHGKPQLWRAYVNRSNTAQPDWKEDWLQVYCKGWPFWVPVDLRGGSKSRSAFRMSTLPELGGVHLPEHPSGFTYQGVI